MHADDVDTYEGPPCEMCRRIMFVGTCTHRPRKRPTLPDIKITPEQQIEIDKILKSIESPPKKEEARMEERQVLVVVLHEKFSPDEVLEKMEAIRTINGVVSVKTMERVFADGLPEAAGGN